MNTDKVQEVFGKRATFYVDSVSHKDQEVLASVAEMCGDLNGRAVLDVATGTGHTALFLAPMAAKVVGLDLTREMLSLARKASVDRGVPNAEWVRGNVDHLPFPDRSFDVVCSRRAPHHFPDLDRALKEMVRVLKGGGKLVIDDRSVPDDKEVDETMNLLDRLHDPSHVREHGTRAWKEALERAGLTVGKVHEYRRHLPLTTMTWNAEREDAAEIERVVTSLSEGLRQRMSVETVGGQFFLDQYYITLQATK
ncbi:MAG: methyltransferase domain-containing protein [Methanomassiliicoccales archaeon]|nr:methyltransferase domain-containing protein [Methanomassiliicoccales archaeon]